MSLFLCLPCMEDLEKIKMDVGHTGVVYRSRFQTFYTVNALKDSLKICEKYENEQISK